MTDEIEKIAERVAAEKSLWDAYQDAETDKRIAERQARGDAGKREAVAKAAQAMNDACAAWLENRRALKSELSDMLKPYGVTADDLRGAL